MPDHSTLSLDQPSHDDRRSTSNFYDLVTVPAHRQHHSDTTTKPYGVLLALVLAIVGGAALGAGYGAVIALCGKKYVNIGLACAFPFWMATPAGLGFMWGHVQASRPRLWISFINVAVCLYAVCVGWVFAVLDGPGLVLSPIELFHHLTDVHFHSLWATPYRVDFIPLTPWLLALRFGSLAWLTFAGLMSLGSETPYPFCQHCQRWMRDETTRRFYYNPNSTQEVADFAADLIAERYDVLYTLNHPIDDKAKGLELSIYRCEGCNSHAVLNAKWHRMTPDTQKTETEQLLESAAGQQVVTSLIVPIEVFSHFSHFEDQATEAA